MQVVSLVKELTTGAQVAFATRHSKLANAVSLLRAQPGVNCQLWAKLAQCALQCEDLSCALDCAKTGGAGLPASASTASVSAMSQASGAECSASDPTSCRSGYLLWLWVLTSFGVSRRQLLKLCLADEHSPGEVCQVRMR